MSPPFAHLLRRGVRRSQRNPRDERGIAIVIVLGVLAVVSMLLVAAFTSVQGEAHTVRNDLDQQKAFSAAQAGVSAYVFHLNQDVNYWTHCSAPSGQVPSSPTNDEAYAVTPLAASTASGGVCDTNNPVSTMIESGANGAAGTFRVKIAGTSAKGTVGRTLVATFKRRGFLDFMYYTRYETLDPVAYNNPGAYTACAAPYAQRPNYCVPISFVSGDAINGPLHSEDQIDICGSPTFGRTASDTIEAPSYADESGQCGASPNFLGTYNSKAQGLLPPPSNQQLLNVALPAYHYTGRTDITLNGSSMTVTNNGATSTVAFPSNGVVYVSTSATLGCPVAYSPFNPSYSAGPGCGNVYVHGNYTSSLTIASDNDIIINGNITTPVNGSGIPTTNSSLGLIAQNFVRIYHPMNNRTSSSPGNCGSASDASGTMTNPQIYAAILSVAHSFIVDNYDCGNQLGTLKVFGAIAQIFRGPVGTGGGTGYLKNYTYDDRLAVQNPPFFLSPIQAAWHVQRQTECAPGVNGC